MRITFDNILFDVNFITSFVEAFLHGQKQSFRRTECIVSAVKDPNGKGKDNYHRIVDAAVQRFSGDEDNKGLARRKAFSQALDKLPLGKLPDGTSIKDSKEFRQTFWKAYFESHKHDFKGVPLTVQCLTEGKEVPKSREIRKLKKKQKQKQLKAAKAN